MVHKENVYKLRKLCDLFFYKVLNASIKNNTNKKHTVIAFKKYHRWDSPQSMSTSFKGECPVNALRNSFGFCIPQYLSNPWYKLILSFCCEKT